MKKETTVGDWISFITKNVCLKCNYHNKDMGVCGGEILPTERAIMRNLNGRGCCNNIKEFMELLKEQKNEQ